jgi:hypothetical protein
MKNMKGMKEKQEARLWEMPNPHYQNADLHGYTQILIFELFHPCTVFLHVLHALHG